MSASPTGLSAEIESVVDAGKPSARLLLIDDDQKLGRLLRGYLEPHGYAVVQASTAAQGMLQAEVGTWELILLDVMLPDTDGLEVLRRLRGALGMQTPIMMLTARGDEGDRILGLEAGADDYVPKISSSRELLARIRALLRRSGPQAHNESTVNDSERLRCGNLTLDTGHRTAVLDDRELRLTALEFILLATLARARGQVCSRDQLIMDAAANGVKLSARAIDVHISVLRRKLGRYSETLNPEINLHSESGRYIRTIRSVGFALVFPKAD